MSSSFCIKCRTEYLFDIHVLGQTHPLEGNKLQDKDRLCNSNFERKCWSTVYISKQWSTQKYSRRTLEKKAYKKKTYSFGTDIWDLLVNMLDGDEVINGNNIVQDNIDNIDHYENENDNV